MRICLFCWFSFFIFGFVNAQPWTIEEPVRFLALGDSYTIGQSVIAENRWPEQLVEALENHGFEIDTLQTIATTGWTTVALQNAIDNQGLQNKGFNMVSLLIGVNDLYINEDINLYRPRLERLIDSALSFVQYDTSQLFMLSIPDYAYTPFGNGNPLISEKIDDYNLINETIASEYGIKYFNITLISREGLSNPDLVAGDGLHPSGLQYELWVSKIMEYVYGVYPTTSVSEIANPDIIISPNPSPGIFRIEIPEYISTEKLKVEIRNLEGRLVASPNFLNGHLIDVSFLPSGTYFIKIKIGKNNIVAESILIY